MLNIKNLSVTTLALILAPLSSGISQASTSDWMAPDHGFQISAKTPAGIPQSSGTAAKISGQVTLTGTHGVGNGSGGGKDHKDSTLLDVMQKDGVELHFYFPDMTTDVTSQVTLNASSNQIAYSYQTPTLQATNLNTLIAVVSHVSPDIRALQSVKSKLDQRILALTSLLQKLGTRKDIDSNDLAVLKQLQNRVQAISARIDQKLSKDAQVLAEMRFPLQVDNLVSQASLNSTVSNHFRFQVSYSLGSAIEGETTNALGQVTRLGNTDDNNEDDSSDKWIARFNWNGSQVKSIGPAALGAGESFSFTYATPALSPEVANSLSVTLNSSDDNGALGKTFGSLAFIEPVAFDTTAPKWLANATPQSGTCLQSMQPVSMSVLDTFGLVDPSSFTASLTGQLTSGSTSTKDATSLLKLSTLDQGQTYNVSADLNPLPEGKYTFSIQSSDLAGNATQPNPNSSTFRINRTPPTVTLSVSDSIYTNKPYTNKPGISFSATTLDFFDFCQIQTVATDNGTPIGLSSTNTLNVSSNLTDGIHQIQVAASNTSDGLSSTPQSFEVIVDTIPATLSSLQPAANAIVQNLSFPVSGKASEPLLYAKVNGQNLTLSPDQRSFSGTYSVQAEGNYTLHFEVADLAMNVTTQDIPIQVLLKVLNESLLSVAPNPDGVHLTIVGAPGATRPGLTVNASASFFNSGSVVAKADGSFSLDLYTFQSAKLTATDPMLGRTDTATVKFGSAGGTLLSGAVRDTSNNPLAGVKVSIANTGISTSTDGSGVFTFSQPVTGDQILIVDGTTIPKDPNATVQKKFSITRVAVSIGLSQSSVLQRPIYLQPTIVDPSRQITSSYSGSITDPQAPGVALNIPANSITFPNGSDTDQISMAKISSEVATVAPVKFAMPTDVIALEPSGLTFSEPVQLTLPNDNNLPAGVDMVIMSMNSRKGVWEIDGAAQVSADGQSVVTKPGMGITHFSLVYAAPIGPTVLNIGEQDVPGADTFNGAMSTTISMPSYKALGKDVTPTLLYKSSWAKPTTVISNLFDIPKNDVSIDSDTGELHVKSIHQCFLFFCQDVEVYADVTTQGHAWYEPDFITGQFFTAGIAGAVQTFTGVPNRAKLSYATDLIDPNTNDYLPSGLYPYYSHWEVHLKHIVVGTQSVTVWSNVSAPQTSVTSLDSVQAINQAFPQDVGGPLFVSNEINSSAGRGWKVGGVARIVNPNSNRVMIEEADGSTSSFSIQNTVSTLFNAQPAGIDLTHGVDLSSWPNAIASKANLSGASQIDLSGSGQTSTVGNFFQMNGVIQGTNWFYDTHANHRTSNYSVSTNPQAYLLLPDGTVFGTDSARDMVFKLSNGTQTKFAGQFMSTPTLDSPLWVPDYGIDYVGPYISNFCAAHPEISCGSITWQYETCYGCAYGVDQGINGPSSGLIPVKGFSGDGAISQSTQLNSPMGMSAGPRPNTIVVADTGNNRVRLIDLSNNTIQTVAGNGQYYGWDVGENAMATDVSVSHPRGVIYDSVGNLYISTQAGMIRKVDTTGRITTFAGAQGGTLVDSILATKASFVTPSGMTVDNKNGYLYVADTGHHRIVRIDFASGMATNVAGNGNQSDSPDGLAALSSSLNNPTNVGLDNDGNLLIADSGNQKIKRVTFQGGQSGGVLAFASVGTMVKGARKNPDGSWVPWLVRNSDGTWTRNYRNGIQDLFDSSGRQIATTDRVGRQTTFAYDGNGNPVSITDPTRQVTTYSYSGNALSAVTDPAGRVTSFTIDPSTNQLKSVHFPDGSQKSYSYDQKGLMLSETDQRGNTTQYVYNKWNRLESTISPTNSTIAVTDSASKTVGNDYTNGSVGTLQPVGTEPGGVKDTLVDASGNTTQIAKDSRGFVATVTNAAGSSTSIQRNIAGKPVKITRPDGTQVTFTYDPDTEDLLSQTDTSTGITTSQTYDAYGNLLTQTNGRGYTSKRFYDPNSGLLLSAVDPMGHSLSFTYGPYGLATSATNSLGIRVSATYDSVGNKTSSIDNANHATSYTYDASGNVVSATDANGRTTRYGYDLFNRITAVTVPKGEVTRYSYLSTGALFQIKDPLGNITTFEYDTAGRLTKKTDSLGMTHNLSYDANGNVIQEVDPNGTTKRYTYDNLNRLIQKSLPDDVLSFTYDAKNNITKAKNSISEVDFSYDVLDRLKTTRSFGLGTLSNLPDSILSFDWDENGKRVTLSDPTGTTAYEYDAADRLTSLINPIGQAYTYAYNDITGARSQTRPGSQTSYTFDSNGLLASLTHDTGSTNIASFTFSRDLTGDLSQITRNSVTRTFTYDLDNQIKTASNPEAPMNSMQSESFDYDANYNRTSDQNGSYSYDAANKRLTEDYNYRYFYDNNGNLIKKLSKQSLQDVTNFTYSSENQLIGFQVYLPGSNTPVKEVTYSYDALGRRIQKRVMDYSAPTDARKTFTRSYVYDGQSILLEYDANNDLLARYTHGGTQIDDVLSTNITQAGVDAGLANSAGTYQYLKDWQGSVTDITDSNGNLIQHYIYSVFGEILSIKDANANEVSNQPPVNTSYTFTGREFDKESGYLYYRARYYDPNTGRFLQEDKDPGALKIPSSLVNSYTYTGNNPLNRLDPTGKSFLTSVLIGVAIVGLAVFTGGIAGAAIGAALGGGLLGAAGGLAAGAIVGGITGGLVGGIGAGLTGGNFSQGFWSGAAVGAVYGGMAGLAAGYIGANSPVKGFKQIFNDMGIGGINGYLFDLNATQYVVRTVAFAGLTAHSSSDFYKQVTTGLILDVGGDAGAFIGDAADWGQTFNFIGNTYLPHLTIDFNL